jgi:hypothetical protein
MVFQSSPSFVAPEGVETDPKKSVSSIFGKHVADIGEDDSRCSENRPGVVEL